MAIETKCDKCGKELTDYGALLFSPPNDDNKVNKYHLCEDCYQKIIADFNKKFINM